MPRARIRIAVLVAAFATAIANTASAQASAAQASPPPSVISAYSLAAPVGTTASGLVVRAVVPAGGDCPRLTVTDVDGTVRVLPMRVRPLPARTSPAFDAITVCSRPMPAHAARASVSGVDVPAHLPTSIDRLAMLGDTGCRIASWQVQDCSDQAAWPLARIAQAVADADPDAILINGDFFYREAACPADQQAACGSSPPPVTVMPFTDTAYGWIADALLPMAPMLAAAPLVITRGNHEACNRGGNGFFLLMDPREGTEDTCAPTPSAGGLTAAATVPTSTYAVDLAVTAKRTLRLAIVDSAGGNDVSISPYAAIQRPTYVAAARLTTDRRGRESWLFTHRPLYAIVPDVYSIPGQPFNPWSSADQTAASTGLLGTYDLVFGSHMHLAQAVQLPGLPPQLVLGNGGTLLDPAIGYPLPTTGPLADGMTYPAPSWAWVHVDFGFTIATPGSSPGQWRLSMRDTKGRQVARCGLADRTLYCR